MNNTCQRMKTNMVVISNYVPPLMVGWLIFFFQMCWHMFFNPVVILIFPAIKESTIHWLLVSISIGSCLRIPPVLTMAFFLPLSRPFSCRWKSSKTARCDAIRSDHSNLTAARHTDSDDSSCLMVTYTRLYRHNLPIGLSEMLSCGDIIQCLKPWVSYFQHGDVQGVLNGFQPSFKIHDLGRGLV